MANNFYWSYELPVSHEPQLQSDLDQVVKSWYKDFVNYSYVLWFCFLSFQPTILLQTKAFFQFDFDFFLSTCIHCLSSWAWSCLSRLIRRSSYRKYLAPFIYIELHFYFHLDWRFQRTPHEAKNTTAVLSSQQSNFNYLISLSLLQSSILANSQLEILLSALQCVHSFPDRYLLTNDSISPWCW